MSPTDGGYDDGYAQVPCFWGTNPGSFVSKYLQRHGDDLGARVLDLGCGEGKNAAAFAKAGYSVDAIDCSNIALTKAQKLFGELGIRWHLCDARMLALSSMIYDVVVAYGLFHCLATIEEIACLIELTKVATKVGGHHIVCTFNTGSHDLSAHPNFAPTLASHEWYCRKYSDWIISSATDEILQESHPHNNLPHHHSLTRLIAKRVT
jgi:tellurite methyltransferase